MFAIIMLVLLGFITIGGVLAGVVGRSSAGYETAAIGAVLFVFTWIISSAFYVDTREVAIVASFGNPIRTESEPGLSWAAPWTNVITISTANQPVDYDGAERICFKLKGDQGSSDGEACVNLNLSWQVQGNDDAIKLWKDRKEFDRIKNEVVNPMSTSTIVGVMGNYNADEANNSMNTAKFNDAINAELNKVLNPKGIKVKGVAVRGIDLSDKVKERLEKKNTDRIDAERAVIQQGTARIDAETNLIKQGNLNDLVNQANCLEITNSWDFAKNGPLPSLWDCGLSSKSTAVAVK